MNLISASSYDSSLSIKNKEHIMAKHREKIKLKSSEGKHFIYTTKNKSNTPARLELKKYDPDLRRKVIFKETK